ncbi:hypothetical protein [Streptomyces xantholiticus]|nr:hypothetical protein [Streptomyces xantholiticus]GGW30867.1 hypothetical protein GCM10010381_14190 [Streptomyces xantholiticus]
MHYSRPDVTHLLLNQAQQRPVDTPLPAQRAFDEPATAGAVAAEG